MADNRRHTEFFGPDLARGPVLSGAPQTAAVQLATALAQLRAPLLRSDDDLRAHATFIRELAERLFPDWATSVLSDVGTLSAGSITTSIRVPTGQFNAFECWLADASGGGVSATAPTTVTWTVGTVVQEIVAKKHFRILTPETGNAEVSVAYGAAKTWRWAISRNGRVYYSDALFFS
jgi:hypothetical protein